MKHHWDPDIESLSLEELQERFGKSDLINTIKYCINNSRFYRQKYESVGIDPVSEVAKGKFELLPFTEKSELLSDQIEHPPFGSGLCVRPEKIIRVHRTSGSTGRPLYVAMTFNDIENMHKAGARCFWSAGLRPQHTVVHCLNYCMWMGGLSDHLSLERTGATVIPYGIGNSRGLIDLIRTLSVTAISCTPSYMAKLESIVKDELNLDPKDIGLKLGLFGGEPGIQQPDTRRVIEETWGINAMDANYGMADVLSVFGSECEARDGLHFHGQGLLYVELIEPESGKVLPIEKGQVGELVLTNLRREAQPLIRFRSRDVAYITGTDKCSCGRGGFRFKILGRSDDMLHVKGVNVFPSAVGNIISRFSDILTGEYEIVLRTHPPYQFLPLRIEVKRGFSSESVSRRLQDLVETIRSELSVKVQCEIVSEGSIKRTGGKKSRVIKEGL